MPQSGDAGPNTIFGSADGETINGGGGNDLLFGDAGDDLLLGEADDDVLLGEVGADTLNGGEGKDTAAYISESGLKVSLADASKNTGDAAGDVFISIENLTGSQGDDWLEGDASDNYLAGKEGNDTLLGGAGADTLNGGDGIDTADYSGSEQTYVDLEDQSSNRGAALGDQLLSIENVIGSDAADELYGDSSDNILSGKSGNDYLDGRGGNDTLIGGAGDDTYYIGEGDTVIEVSGEGYDVIHVSADYVLGDAVEVEVLVISLIDETVSVDVKGNRLANRMIGHSGINVLEGGDGDDFLDGSGGDDTLDGGRGDDFFFGGFGSNGGDADLLIGGEGVDTVSYASIFPTSNFVSLIDPSLNTGSASGDRYQSIENVIGGDHGDTIVGSDDDNVLSGINGDDRLEGGAGDDTLAGGEGGDALIGGEGSDTAFYVVENGAGVVVDLADPNQNGPGAIGDTYSSIENVIGTELSDGITGDGLANVLSGREGNDILNGGAGNDTLNGGAGEDLLNGGDGIDTVIYTGTERVRVYLYDSSENGGAAEYDDYVDIENVVGGQGDDALRGDEKANVLSGGDGNDSLYGWGGADTLIGGSGNDSYSIWSDEDKIAVIVEAGGGGYDRLFTDVSYALNDAAEVEVLEAGSSRDALELTGNRYANDLIGNAWANVLDGRGGADTMRGGAGDDTYHVDDAGDVLDESSGTDTVISSLSFSLAGTNAENLTASGAGNLVLTGSEAANVLTGNVGANQLYGAAGNDTLRAGAGNDALDGGIGADALDGGEGFDWVSFASTTSGVTASLSGGTGGDAAGDSYTAIEGLIGSGFADTFTGNGSAVLQGGAGDDTYHISGGDRVVESAGGGIDIVYTSASAIDLAAFAHVEHVIATSLGSVVVNGDAGANTLNGGVAADVLNGGAGADVMNGGTGNDVYYVDDAWDQVIEAAGGGLDSVFTSVSYALANEVENLAATGSAGISLTGNGLANTLTGNAGKNTLKGESGHDVVKGLNGVDKLYGGSGNDKLYGGYGNDTLYGNTGRDMFVFEGRLASSSRDRRDNFDKIKDFKVRDDSIYLDNAIFKKLGSGTEAKPKLLKSAYFKIGSATDKNDYVLYDKKTGVLSYDADGSGRGKAVEIAQLSKKLAMTHKDFYVI